jgi:hypothetical protein
VAVILALFGFVADVFGIIGFANGKAGTEPATAAASTHSPDPEPQTTPASASVSEPSLTEDSTTAEASSWVVLREGVALYLTSILAGTDECVVDMLDFDEIDEYGSIHIEEPSGDSTPAALDVMWNPCTGFDSNEVYFGASESSSVVIAPAAESLDAKKCFAQASSVEPNLGWVIDPYRPDDLPLRVGMTLCVLTSSNQVVLAEFTEVESASDSDPWIRLALDVSLWTFTG